MRIHKYQSYRDEMLNLELGRIALLEDGWYDGEGTKYTGADLDTAGDLLDAMFESSDDLPSPYLTPDPDGTLRAEWITPYKNVLLIIDFRKRTVWALALSDESPAKVVDEHYGLEYAPEVAGFVTRSLVTVPRGDTSPYKEEGE